MQHWLHVSISLKPTRRKIQENQLRRLTKVLSASSGFSLTIHWCSSPALEPGFASAVSSTELRDRRAGEGGAQPWDGKEAEVSMWVKAEDIGKVERK